MQEMQVQPLGQEDPLEKGMTTNSSIFAWKNLMDKGTSWVIVHGSQKSQTLFSD